MKRIKFNKLKGYVSGDYSDYERDLEILKKIGEDSIEYKILFERYINIKGRRDIEIELEKSYRTQSRILRRGYEKIEKILSITD